MVDLPAAARPEMRVHPHRFHPAKAAVTRQAKAFSLDQAEEPLGRVEARQVLAADKRARAAECPDHKAVLLAPKAAQPDRKQVPQVQWVVPVSPAVKVRMRAVEQRQARTAAPAAYRRLVVAQARMVAVAKPVGRRTDLQAVVAR